MQEDVNHAMANCFEAILGKRAFELHLVFSLPRVINVKFPLQPKQKYNITQYELGSERVNIQRSSAFCWKFFTMATDTIISGSLSQRKHQLGPDCIA